MPRHVTDIKLQLDMMKAAGFSGCVASSDATHVPIINCRFGLKQSHLGWKLSTTARTYNISVTGTRRILSSTGGHPSRWNDKSIVMFDDFLTSVKDGNILDDVTFTLYEYDSNRNIIKRNYSGAWVLVDNGYHSWSTMICPYKLDTSIQNIRWSQWVSSYFQF